MAEKRRGLGRGLGALIPSASSGDARPVDVFFPGSSGAGGAQEAADAAAGAATATLTEAPSATAPTEPTTGDAPSAPPATGGAATASTDVAAEAVGTLGTPGVPEATGTPGAPGAATAAADDGSSIGAGAASVPDQDGLLPVPGARFAELPVGAIRPNPRQPRTVFDEDALAELVGSIREIGVLQPVVVRQVESDGDVRYELIMGERRWRATQQAGLDTVPAIVRETDDADLLRDALLENLHRSELNPLEEAAAYQQLLDDFGCTHEELARRIHRSRPQISNTLRLLKLPPLVQRRVAAGVLSAGHARALLGLEDGAAMERLAQRIVAEGLSVRATEEIVTLGGEPDRTTASRRPRARAGERNAALDELAGRLSDRFDTRVKIALGKSKGKVTIEFASVQDLNRILDQLSPGDPGLLR